MIKCEPAIDFNTRQDNQCMDTKGMLQRRFSENYIIEFLQDSEFGSTSPYHQCLDMLFVTATEHISCVQKSVVQRLLLCFSDTHLVHFVSLVASDKPTN